MHLLFKIFQMSEFKWQMADEFFIRYCSQWKSSYVTTFVKGWYRIVALRFCISNFFVKLSSRICLNKHSLNGNILRIRMCTCAISVLNFQDVHKYHGNGNMWKPKSIPILMKLSRNMTCHLNFQNGHRCHRNNPNVKTSN